MTTHDQQPDTFAWRAAPSHLKTRRQLRAMGLRPNGQDPTALMIREAAGRKRRQLWAHLFDTRTAVPKRTATPAQMEAVAKAVRARQIRAAERRGISAAELTQPADPGPAWTGTHEREETAMSDMYEEANRTRAALDADILEDRRNWYENALGSIDMDRTEDFAIHMHDPTATAEQFYAEHDNHDERTARYEQTLEQAQTELDQHLQKHQEELTTDPVWGPYLAEREITGTDEPVISGKPTGHGQRITHLHAVAAVNQARRDRDELRRLREAAERGNEEAVGALKHLRDQAELVLSRNAAAFFGQREHKAMALATGLLWREDDPRADELAREIVENYRGDWGVIVDPEALTVDIDPQFDPAGMQQFEEAAAVWAREDAALGIVAAAPMTAAAKDAALAALTDWTRSWGEPDSTSAYITTQAQRREQLSQDLAKAQLNDTDRARVEFTVDYLRADVSRTDLLDTPVLVDPGEEVRGRVPKLLEHFAGKQIAPAEIAEQISVMTDADQDAVRAVGRSIVAGETVDYRVWPDYVDRDHIAEELTLYAMDVEEQRAQADYIVEEDTSEESPARLGVDDELGQRLERMATRREQLHTIATATGPNGLTTMERTQLTAVLTDLDAGRIRNDKELPELLWVAERNKADLDQRRSMEPASEFSRAAEAAIRETISHSPAVDHRSREGANLDNAVTAISDSLFSVANGAPLGVDNARHEFANKRTRLGEALAQAGIDRETKLTVREQVDSRARDAGKLGRGAAQRAQQWTARTDRVVAARNDNNAQRAAVAAGRAPRQGRNCTTRTEPAAQPSSPAPTRAAGRRQLHSDLGR